MGILKAGVSAIRTAAENGSGTSAFAVSMLMKSSGECDGGKCKYGFVNKGKFCTECGAKKPADIL